ncbi:MAG: hypothetical protein RI928_517 [Pseudomonadota bacterium]|jgi:hypothetical protein
MKTFNSALLISFFVFCFSGVAQAQVKLPACQGSDVKTWTNCQGSQKYNDGTYVGEFQNGAPNGRGEISMTNGNKYVGEFKNGCFDGIGFFTYANGDTYEGQFAKCKKEGRGKGRLANGQSFDFVFKDDKQISSTPIQPQRPKSALPQDPNAALNLTNWKSSDDLNLLDMVVFFNEKSSGQRITKDLDGNIIIGNGNEAVRVDLINFPLNYFNHGNNVRLPNIYSIFENRLNPEFSTNSAKQDDSRKKYSLSSALLERHLSKLFKDNNIKASKIDIQFKDIRSPGSAAIVIFPRFFLSTQNQSVVQQLKSLLGEDPAFDRNIQYLGQFRNGIVGQELGIFPVAAVTDEATRLSEQKIAQQKMENAIATSFKEKIFSAVENKIELAAAIRLEIKNVENNVCIVEKPVESLTLLGIIETDEFIKWSGLKSADGVSERLKIFKTPNELYEASNNGKCAFIVDYAENMKSYLNSLERDKKSLKYGVAYTRDESIPLLAKARGFENRQDMEIALNLGPTGASAEEFSELKKQNINSVEDFKKIAKRMNLSKYDLEPNPTSEVVLAFLSDEKEAKKLKTTAIAIKKAREKKAAAEEAARIKQEALDEAERKKQAAARERAELEKFQRMKYESIFMCEDEYAAGRDSMLAENIMNAFSSGQSQMYAAMLTSSTYRKFCSSLSIPFTNFELLKKSGRLVSTRGETKYYLVKMDQKTTIGVFGR